MPDTIVTKPPSAELRPDQKDEDSLPPYADLDRMLHMLVEEEASVDDVVAKYGFDRDAVARIERLLMLAEYKRRQAPPGVKLSTRNFGRDRRYPITHGFRSGSTGWNRLAQRAPRASKFVHAETLRRGEARCWRFRRPFLLFPL